MGKRICMLDSKSFRICLASIFRHRKHSLGKQCMHGRRKSGMLQGMRTGSLDKQSMRTGKQQGQNKPKLLK